MIRSVRVGAFVVEKANERYGPDRVGFGVPDEFDFVSGPLAAAVFAFKDFDALRWEIVPAVRSYTIVDPFFGAVLFTAVLLNDGTVEIADFEDDPDYWAVINSDPDD